VQASDLTLWRVAPTRSVAPLPLLSLSLLLTHNVLSSGALWLASCLPGVWGPAALLVQLHLSTTHI
jgi:hypothetical protein